MRERARHPGPIARPSARRDMRLMTGDGLLYCFMVGSGETYFVAFALALGFGEVLSGLLASVPLVVGGTAQLVTPWAVKRLGSLRAWVVGCATVQALSFVPLVVAAIAGRVPLWTLYLVVSVYWSVNYAQGPAWNTWAATLVPAGLRAKYFALRSRILQVGTLLGLIGAGVLLRVVKGGTGSGAEHAEVFAVIFGAAGIARLIASRLLAAQSEPEPMPPDFRHVGAREFLSRWRHGHDARFLTYMLAMQAAVQISGPFFAPYMLAQLELDYAQFMALLGMSFVARMIVLPGVGRLAHARGPRVVLLIGGIGLVPLGALWAVSDSFWYLLAAQLITGSIWACYEVATLLLIFETIPSSERTSVLSLFNLANAVALVIGSFAGAALLTVLDGNPWAYHAVFVASTAARLATVPLLLRIKVPKFEAAPMPTMPIAIRPSAGVVERPVLPVIEGQEPGDVPLPDTQSPIG